MKKLLLIIAIITASAYVYGQYPYSCVLPNNKVYYTNSAGYLRGMRIDSVSNTANSATYYPFKTARVIPPMGAWDPVQSDTLGGSWLGNTIDENNDGYTYILNRWNDTVRIKRSAALNESWVFFKDTSSLYYEATVIGIDTMTINGMSDSVKTIRLNTMNENGNVPGDLLNNLELKLSKSNGLVQTLGLYMFPYHLPGQDYDAHLDYYLLLSTGSVLSDSTLIFKLVDYKTPVATNIYDFEIGDYFSYSKSYTVTGYFSYAHTDTITNKLNFSDSVKYDIHSYINQEQFNPYTHQMEDTSWVASTHITAKNESIADTTYMPEEWHQPTITYYYPEDSGYCTRSPRYTFDVNGYFDTNGVFEYGEYSYSLPVIYKEKIGLVSETHIYPSDPPTTITESLKYVRKGSNICYGNDMPVSIRSVHKNELNYLIYPNPAKSFINIQIDNNNYQDYTIKLIDVLGNVSYTNTTKEKMLSIPVGNLSAGIYYIHITTNDGRQGVQKIAIAK